MVTKSCIEQKATYNYQKTVYTILILYASSHPNEIEKYISDLKAHNIIFNYVNENPEIDNTKGSFGHYDKKPYFNVLFDDKAGFDPINDWEFLYNYFKNTEIYKQNSTWEFKHANLITKNNMKYEKRNFN